MAGRYIVQKSSDGEFYFNLKAPNGEVILTSERYIVKQSAYRGIESCRINAPIDPRYERRRSVADEPYFVLKAANHEIIGRSEMYSSGWAMEQGISSVKTNAPGAEVVDLTLV